MKVIGLPRVSTKKQAESGDSIDSQSNTIKKFCDDNNHELIDLYIDSGKSASVSDDKINIKLSGDKFVVEYDLSKRPALLRVLKEINSQKFEGIMFYKWDRLSRYPPFAKNFQRYVETRGISLIPTNDTEDPLASDIVQVVSKYEIDKMKERIRSTRINQFEKGIIVGRCPIGYKPIFKNKRDRRGIIGIKIDTKKVEMIKDIFEKTGYGVGYKKICDLWKIKPQTYYNIIKNKIYIGVVSFEGQERDGVHDKIINPELFYKVNEK